MYVNVIFFKNSKTLKKLYFKTYLKSPIDLNLHSGVTTFRCLNQNSSKTGKNEKN